MLRECEHNVDSEGGKGVSDNVFSKLLAMFELWIVSELTLLSTTSLHAKVDIVGRIHSIYDGQPATDTGGVRHQLYIFVYSDFVCLMMLRLSVYIHVI